MTICAAVTKGGSPMASDARDRSKDSGDTDVDVAALAAPIRAACADLHPSEALRAAVLLGLPSRPPALSPSRWWRAAVATVGLVAAAVVALLFWPSRRAEQDDVPPRGDAPADPSADLAATSRQRVANRKEYDREIGRLRGSATGMWVMISAEPPPGLVGAFKPVVIGHSAEEVGRFAPHAKHRYVFRVGDEGDLEPFASEWYAPRFAGSGFAQALGVRTMGVDNSIVVIKGDARVERKDATPFPRVPVSITTPDGSATTPPDAQPEMWLGSVGPTLMLTPEDDARLGLARWEVPGVENVMDVPCRRVLVRAAIPGIPGDTTVVGAVPDVSREVLVGLSRARNSFWSWAESLRPSLDLPREGDARGQWIVFGNDRVLGRGPRTETEIAEDEGRFRAVLYNRFYGRVST